MAEIIIYNTEDGQANIKLYANDGTVWLNQTQIAELFDTTKQNISLHINNIFAEGELEQLSVVKDYLTTERVKQRKLLTMQFWRNSVDKLLEDHDVPVLKTKGAYSHEQAKEFAEKSYIEFNNRRKKYEAQQADTDDIKILEAEIKDIGKK